MSHTSQENGRDILSEDLSSRTIHSCLLPRKDKIRPISWLEIPQDLGLRRRSACHTFSELIIHCRPFLYVGSPLGLELVSVTICFLFDTVTDFPPSTKQISMAVCWVCFFLLKILFFCFTVWARYLSVSERSFRKCYRLLGYELLYRLWATIGKTSTLRCTRFLLFFFVDSVVFLYYYPQCLGKPFAQTVTNCLLSSEENTKNQSFLMFLFMTLGINMIPRKMNPFFSSTIWALSVDIFHFSISRPSKLNSMGYSFCIFWSVKCILTWQRWHFQAC